MDWTVNGQVFTCKLEDTACHLCGRMAVVALPPPILAVQPDGTTHVCHPGLRGCNHGFKKECHEQAH